ncbi:hypothetical protein CJO32_05795 [Bifidobacterium longum]|nr:hypothetical protein CJO32_05795 [Bifidobacterium longum]RDX01909.1 hypothetical protein CE166_10145 [Bifidobacterium longum]RDX04882.1 hypothetical protein CE171_08355 [Bifidobacterium longum]RDX09034.1 hypothetical protein CE165_06065 [Bifidobacterium longum]RDX12253.1 hypothetical protein CE158_06865 [Bifidobacterium longum]
MLVWTSGRAFWLHTGCRGIRSPLRGADLAFRRGLLPFRGAGGPLEHGYKRLRPTVIPPFWGCAYLSTSPSKRR